MMQAPNCAKYWHKLYQLQLLYSIGFWSTEAAEATAAAVAVVVGVVFSNWAPTG